ncbi:MAG TPA: DUF5666 domain-containing protein [Thermoleophilaceae bacterium]
MKRLLPSCATAIALLLVPASAAAAAPQTGSVLRVDRAHHRIEIVDSQHAVHSYATPRKATRKLRAGVHVSFQSSGGRISSLRVKGRARKLAFYGTVVSTAGHGAVFRLGDGKELKLASSRQSHHSGRGHHTRRASVRINLQGLQPGQVVLITENADRTGNLTITIKLVPSSTDPNGDDQDVTGTITAIGATSVTIETDDSSQTMTFQASSDVLDGFDVGDDVDVTYYAAGDGTLVADDVEPVDDGSDDLGGDDVDALGVVTAIGADSIGIQVDGGGPMTFEADSDLTDGFGVGDYVDVTYAQNPDGTFTADDVEYADDGSGNDDSGD